MLEFADRVIHHEYIKTEYCILHFQKGSSSKADVVNSTVKVEFGEKSLGESAKVDCTPETPAEFNYTVNLNCTYDDPTALDEIAHKPVVCKLSSDELGVCQVLFHL